MLLVNLVQECFHFLARRFAVVQIEPVEQQNTSEFLHNNWFFTESWGEEQLGGASADAQSYWQGRFAACAFVECV